MLSFTEYKKSHEDAVKKFNQRLSAQNKKNRFSQNCNSQTFPQREGVNIFQNYFLALENDKVRGGYILKNQLFKFDNEIKPIMDYQFPLSEGIIDKNYNFLAILMVIDAIKRNKNLFALGMNGVNGNLPRLLKKLRWNILPVPFLFKIRNVKNFLINIKYLHKNLFVKKIFIFLSKINFFLPFIFLIKLIETLKFKKIDNHLKIDIENKFSEWTDAIWENSHKKYKFLALRTHQELNVMYPEMDNRLKRLKIIFKKKCIGWVVVIHNKHKNHKQFGNMNLGSIVDCMCLNGYENILIRAADNYLTARNVDLIISNQYHYEWVRCLKTNFFLKGPTNFAFATSPNLTKEILKIDRNFTNIHLNRGDGDGPINL